MRALIHKVSKEIECDSKRNISNKISVITDGSEEANKSPYRQSLFLLENSAETEFLSKNEDVLNENDDNSVDERNRICKENFELDQNNRFTSNENDCEDKPNSNCAKDSIKKDKIANRLDCSETNEKSIPQLDKFNGIAYKDNFVNTDHELDMSNSSLTSCLTGYNTSQLSCEVLDMVLNPEESIIYQVDPQINKFSQTNESNGMFQGNKNGSVDDSKMDTPFITLESTRFDIQGTLQDNNKFDCEPSQLTNSDDLQETISPSNLCKLTQYGPPINHKIQTASIEDSDNTFEFRKDELVAVEFKQSDSSENNKDHLLFDPADKGNENPQFELLNGNFEVTETAKNAEALIELCQKDIDLEFPVNSEEPLVYGPVNIFADLQEFGPLKKNEQQKKMELGNRNEKPFAFGQTNIFEDLVEFGPLNRNEKQEQMELGNRNEKPIQYGPMNIFDELVEFGPPNRNEQHEQMDLVNKSEEPIQYGPANIFEALPVFGPLDKDGNFVPSNFGNTQIEQPTFGPINIHDVMSFDEESINMHSVQYGPLNRNFQENVNALNSSIANKDFLSTEDAVRNLPMDTHSAAVLQYGPYNYNEPDPWYDCPAQKDPVISCGGDSKLEKIRKECLKGTETRTTNIDAVYYGPPNINETLGLFGYDSSGNLELESMNCALPFENLNVNKTPTKVEIYTKNTVNDKDRSTARDVGQVKDHNDIKSKTDDKLYTTDLSSTLAKSLLTFGQRQTDIIWNHGGNNNAKTNNETETVVSNENVCLYDVHNKDTVAKNIVFFTNTDGCARVMGIPKKTIKKRRSSQQASGQTSPVMGTQVNIPNERDCDHTAINLPIGDVRESNDIRTAGKSIVICNINESITGSNVCERIVNSNLTESIAIDDVIGSTAVCDAHETTAIVNVSESIAINNVSAVDGVNGNIAINDVTESIASITNNRPTKTVETFLCEICNTHIEGKTNMLQHLEKHTKLKPFSCHLCAAVFTTKSHLNHHVKMCEILQTSQTSQENQGFGDTSSKNGLAFTCNICNEKFSHKKLMKQHMVIHVDQKLHKCNTCQKVFRHHGTLQSHLRTHTGEKPYKCKVCDKSFLQSNQLTVHVRSIHTGEKPFVCNLCKKGFSDKGHLQRHMFAHSGEKPFSCDVCSKSFSQRYQLKVHMQIHSTQKHDICPLCNSSFSAKSSLKRHMISTHSVK